jgi:hypothetical protein
MALKNTIKEFRAHLGDSESILDNEYKNISERIELHWGYVEFYEFIAQILVVEKDRDRSGFSYEAILEINKLQEIHEQVFPGLKSKPKKWRL